MCMARKNFGIDFPSRRYAPAPHCVGVYRGDAQFTQRHPSRDRRGYIITPPQKEQHQADIKSICARCILALRHGAEHPPTNSAKIQGGGP